jgi:hypothetical protein
MLKEYSQKGRPTERITRYLLVVPAILVFSLALVLFGFLSNLRTGKEKRDLQQITEKTRQLLDSVRVVISESGYIVRNIGSRELYVPVVQTLIANDSSSMIEDLELTSDFESEKSFFCQGYSRIFRLRPGEITEASLKCIELTGFGTIVNGVSLAQTARPMHYDVRVRLKDAYASIQKGTLTFKIIKSVSYVE